jgi:hypothetical protein
MTPNTMAHFGDDHVSGAYEPGIQNYVKSVFARTHNFTDSFLWKKHFTSQVLGYYFQSPDTKKYNLGTQTFTPATGKTKFYNKSGIMISRPSDSLSTQGLAVTIKLFGGTIDEGHNHQDVGSYSICLDDELIAGEVGGPRVYNASAFGKARYNSPTMNSYGHPVPFINEKLQGRVWELLQKKKPLPSYSSFSSSDATDSILYDMKKSLCSIKS